MSKAVESLEAALKQAMENRPKVGGFPILAETLRLAGISRNLWALPACQSVYATQYGAVVMQGHPLIIGTSEIPVFDEAAVIKALRTDQAGESTFPEFLNAIWKAGVVGYDVDFNERKVVYFGISGESYTESYPAVELNN